MVTKKALTLALAAALAGSGASLADSPPNLEVPDTHSVQSTGKISLFRVQTEGLGFGKGDDAVQAEVLVTLDSSPKMVYTLRINNEAPPVNKVLADTLRDAYINNVPVTLYHQIAPGKNNVKIHMVQMGKNK